MFLDDARIKNFTSCFKEQKFLEFFYKNLKFNETDRHVEAFPYLSLCGRERNYLRCDDLPLVVTEMDYEKDIMYLNQLKSLNWAFRFDPANLYHNFDTGRLYYLFENERLRIETPETVKQDHSARAKLNIKHAFDRLPFQIALVKSSISINLLKNVVHDQSSSSSEKRFQFEYKAKVYEIGSDDSSTHSFNLVKKYSSYKDHEGHET